MMHQSGNARATHNGFILIQAMPGSKVPELAKAIARVPDVVKADRVHGAYNVIAEVREPGENAGMWPAARTIGELDRVLRAIPLSTETSVETYVGSDGEAA